MATALLETTISLQRSLLKQHLKRLENQETNLLVHTGNNENVLETLYKITLELESSYDDICSDRANENSLPT